MSKQESAPQDIGRMPGQSGTCFRCSARIFDSYTDTGKCHMIRARQKQPGFKPPMHCPANNGTDNQSVTTELRKIIRRRG